MEGVTLRWGAATVVLQGLLALIFLLSGISALKCHGSTTMNLTTPHKGNSSSRITPESGITNCSSTENVCTDVQLILTIDKDVLIISYKGCASKDLMDETKSINSGDRHFAIQFDQSYCFGDLCNEKTREVPKTPIKDKVTGSNQCYTGFEWSATRYIQETTKCGKDYDRCYEGSMNVTISDRNGFSSFPMNIRTCQRSACDVIKSQSFGPINITSESGPCCSGSNCNWEKNDFAFTIVNHGVRTNPYLSYDHYGSGFQGLSLQLCPFLVVLGTTILWI
ncbi:uncharacterized protein LOC118087294 [Zootoca vivipara]|uniref:uncharacterized protein LOC118087294 n=1 Tax=Zootoca vivipara TaxID=8524 RepID=UPI00159202FE|nr:uncharacterized protein LOC118087294 [Zootoca vivipara]